MCDNSTKHTSENGDGMEKVELLQRVFGYSSFRSGQEKLIDGVLSGQDVFGIMPTGGGKSMCYQLPALMLPGITLVISPLISLMRDQVMALKAAGVPAAFLNSTLTGAQMQAAYRNLLAGRYKIVYVAPERLDYPGFGAVVEKLNISFVAVDEAHCISQWGQDFRPSYLRIVQFIDSLPKRPVVGAFTATATRSVQEDVERILELRSPVREVTGFDRPNLYFEVIQPESKDKALLRLLAGRKGKSGIVYCATRKKVESVCELLCDHGYAATRYHAGLSEAERSENQEDFLYDRKTVMVATNAFGMGIDKSNVSFVIHYNMPKSIEAYYQEAGRAGRDGAEADCILLFSPGDVQTARFLINNGSDNEEMDAVQREEVRRQDLERLDAMIGYCKTKSCLRGYILDYFGQKHPAMCGNCGSCKGNFRSVDITREAQIILSCVKRVHDALGYNVGANLLVDNGTIIAKELGVPETVIALTFVALGTSLPELVTAITSLVKGHGSLSVGNIIGANLFNLVLVSGVSVTLAPFEVPVGKTIFGINSSLILDMPLMIVVMALLTVPALTTRKLHRWQGIVLLCIYAAFCAIQFGL